MTASPVVTEDLAMRLRDSIWERVEAGAIQHQHAVFVSAAVGLLADNIDRGRLPVRSGLTSEEAYAELTDFVHAALRNLSRG